jgi:hypothetical protein
MSRCHRFARLWGVFLVLGACIPVFAQVAPEGQVLGAGWVGHSLQVRGTVIAENDHCRQIAVESQGIEGAGGRVWGCWTVHPDRAPDLNQIVQVSGIVTTTRLTRMGPFWRVVPQIDRL